MDSVAEPKVKRPLHKLKTTDERKGHKAVGP